MLKFNKVGFSYDNKTTILDNINLNFNEKKINCLLGPNGSGKTTILKLISKILKPTSGNIVNTNKKISYVFQEDRLIDQLTIYQNLDLIIRDIYKDKNTRSAKINQYLRMVGMQHVKDYYPHQLSESMRQCVSLARAFIYPSTLLLLDEPFTNLDVNAQKKLLNLTIKLWNKTKRTVILVSHDIDLVYALSQHVFMLSNKPINLLKHIQVKSNLTKRKAYNKEYIEFKKQFLDIAKTW